MKIIYVGFAFQHHKGTHGGYHHLAKYGHYDEIIDCQKFFDSNSCSIRNIFVRIKRRIVRRLFGFNNIPWYILRMYWLALANPYSVFHIIYGENLYSPLMRHLPRGCKLVCTFHQPFSWFDNKRWRCYLRQIDSIILVGKTEVNKFKEATGKDNVVYIPHGVFTDFYHPNDSIKKEILLLTVGNWLRDYQFADKVYAQFLDRHPDWRVVVVAKPENTQYIHKDARISCLSGISDEELKSLYQKSTILFLPLIRYTANNSLLESAACGCNILIASDNADNSYIPEELLNIVPMNLEAVMGKLEQMKDSPTYNLSISKFIDEHYSWEVVGKTVQKFLSQL